MDAFWYVQSSAPIRKMEDLAGKKIAYSRPGASSHMAVLAIADQIKAKGLKPAEPVSLGGIPEVYTAVRTGQTDAGWSVRSEEHTSELQSRLHLVCRLLLEKKKK